MTGEHLPVLQIVVPLMTAPLCVLVRNAKAAWAKTQPGRDSTWAHSEGGMECYTCHTSWVTSCFGCQPPVVNRTSLAVI